MSDDHHSQKLSHTSKSSQLVLEEREKKKRHTPKSIRPLVQDDYVKLQEGEKKKILHQIIIASSSLTMYDARI